MFAVMILAFLADKRCHHPYGTRWHQGYMRSAKCAAQKFVYQQIV